MLPLRTVAKLNIHLCQKVQVLAVFLAGILVVASSAIRILATATTVRSYDVTWNEYLVRMWVGIEVDVGLIYASVPACKSLFRAWSQKISTNRSMGDPSRSRNTPTPALDTALPNVSASRSKGRFSKFLSLDLEDSEQSRDWKGGSKSAVVSSRASVKQRGAVRLGVFGRRKEDSTGKHDRGVLVSLGAENHGIESRCILRLYLLWGSLLEYGNDGLVKSLWRWIRADMYIRGLVWTVPVVVEIK